MFTLDESGEYCEEIKKSRFICLAQPVFSDQEAMCFIEENSDFAARHNCWAWKIGSDYRFNDDGEPSGTAGKPILSAIEYAELTNVVVLVIRWFGVIKLGTGGLCRAYGGTTSSCLRQLKKSEIKQMSSVVINVPFEFTNSVYQLIQKEGLTKDYEEYTSDGLLLCLKLETADVERVSIALSEMSRGQIYVKVNN